MTTKNISETYGPHGEQNTSSSDPSDQSPFLGNGWHSVAHKFTADVNAFPAYEYTNKLDAKYIDIQKKSSTCTVQIKDPALNEIADYDGQYGIKINENIDGFDFLLVLYEELESIPTSGAYANDKVVLFSGYNRSTYPMDFDENNVEPNYVGIEEIANEIKIDGILEVFHGDLEDRVLEGEINATQVGYYSRKTVFNEGDQKDRLDGELITTSIIRDTDDSVLAPSESSIPVFEKTGLTKGKSWNCADILRYILNIYLVENPDVRNLLDQKSRIQFVNRFIQVDMFAVINSDLDTIYPSDFDLTGMGVLDAIYKIIDQSRKYSIVKKYRSDGVAMLSLRANDPAQRLLDNPRDVPLIIPIGEADIPAEEGVIHEGGNINLSRENQNVGRVIVRGGHLWVNTLLTTWYTNTVNPIASKNRESAVQADDSSDFSNHCHLLAVDYTESRTGIPAQSYNAMNTKMISTRLLAEIGLPLAEFNETDDQYIFETEKVLEIKPVLFKKRSNSPSRQTEDMIVYTALPVDGSSGESSPVIQPSGDADPFYFIQPIVGTKEDDWKLAVKYKAGRFGEFIIYAGADKDKTDSGKHRFKEYIDASTVPSLPKYPASRGVVSNEIPLYIRCAIKTDYRVRGVAQIPGYDPAKHRTLSAESKEVADLAVQYKDREYDGAGGWNILPDGYIDGDGEGEADALATLQTKAETILSKYVLPGNTGYSTLNYVQFSVMIGDIVAGFEGTGRSFDFDAVVNQVGYDLETKLTVLNYGPIHE